MTNKEVKAELDKLNAKMEKMQLTLEALDAKLSKHIRFIDETYEGLRNPINAAKKWLGR